MKYCKYQKAMWSRAIKDTSAIYGGIINMVVAQVLAIPLAVIISKIAGDPGQWWTQILAAIIALLPIPGMILIQRFLAPMKIYYEQMRLLELKVYEDIDISHYMYAWSQHDLDLMGRPPSPYDTFRIDLRVANTGGASIRNCSIRFISFDFMRRRSNGEWTSNTPLVNQKSFNWDEGDEISDGKIDRISAGGGFAILKFAISERNKNNPGFRFDFIDGLSDQLLLEGQYNVTIQLEAQVEKDGLLVDLSIVQYLVGFEFYRSQFSGILIERIKNGIVT